MFNFSKFLSSIKKEGSPAAKASNILSIVSFLLEKESANKIQILKAKPQILKAKPQILKDILHEGILHAWDKYKKDILHA